MQQKIAKLASQIGDIECENKKYHVQLQSLTTKSTQLDVALCKVA